MVRPSGFALALAAILIAAAVLRTSRLVPRPMHADEANEAVKVGALLEGRGYRFDPNDHHGPTLCFAALPVARLRGERTLAALSEASLRLVPALFGIASVGLLGCLCRPSGPALAALAAAFFAAAPAAVYYSRYFIQETLLLGALLTTVLTAVRWRATGRLAWAVAAGAAAGFALATKESALLYLAAAAVSARLVCRYDPAEAPPAGARRNGWHAVAALACAIVVAALFYTSFGANPGGIADAVAALRAGCARAIGPSGHEKPVWYYAALLTWSHRSGVLLEGAGFMAAALAGGILGWRGRSRFVRGVVWYTLIVATALSATPYKTPWQVIHLIPGLAILAAAAVSALRARRRTRTAGLLVGGAILAELLLQTRVVNFSRPADPRNPYAYVHSSPDVVKIRPRAEQALAAAPSKPIRVISEEYWPLPWYLRGLPVGYWSTPPTECDGALVIASAGQAAVVRSRLHGLYRENYAGLRDGFVCVLFTPEAPP